MSGLSKISFLTYWPDTNTGSGEALLTSMRYFHGNNDSKYTFVRGLTFKLYVGAVENRWTMDTTLF